MAKILTALAVATASLLAARPTQATGLRDAMQATLDAAASEEAQKNSNLVIDIPSCPDGAHFRFCWRECNDKVCGKVNTMSEKECLATPLMCMRSEESNALSLDVLRENCRCDDEKLLWDPETLSCVASQKKCTNDPIVKPAICPEGMEFKSCGSACVKTCGSPDPGNLCIASCESGCFCQNPKRWYDPVTNSCVRKRKCSKPATDI